MGGSLEQVAELVERLRGCAPVGVCLDTCHLHVKGYDLVTEEGWAETRALIGETVGFEAVKVWHCNDAKAAMGSKLDRHEHIGEGTIGGRRRLVDCWGMRGFVVQRLLRRRRSISRETRRGMWRCCAGWRNRVALMVCRGAGGAGWSCGCGLRGA